MNNKPKEHPETGVNIHQSDDEYKKKSKSESDKVTDKVKGQVHNILNKGK